jgi:hypothetical protein
MDKRTVVVTERDGKYQIQNNGMTEFELLGILECIVFDMKNAGRMEMPAEQENAGFQKNETVLDQIENEQQIKKESVQESSVPDLRTRIGNAVKAIQGLGGKTEASDLSKLTEEELQVELEELTNQYKWLKNSKATK